VEPPTFPSLSSSSTKRITPSRRRTRISYDVSDYYLSLEQQIKDDLEMEHELTNWPDDDTPSSLE
jgi:hypothetical protein